jgi:Lysine-specific metallo-endopeptidase
MPIPIITSKVSPVNPGTLVAVDVLKDLVTAGRRLVERAATLPNVEHKKAWFGHAATSNADEITAWTAKMFAYLNDGLKTLNFSCCDTAGSIASFAQYATEKVRGGKENPTSVRYMQINAGFLDTKYSYGERVGSILHEITHMCIGTNDEKILERDCYGAPLCGALARIRPETALTNADNWAYYFTSYHTDLGLTGDNWKYLTEEEVEERNAGMKCTIEKGVR